MSKKYRVEVYFGPVTGAKPPKSKRDREVYGSFNKDTFALYKSHTKSETGEAGDEKRIDNRFNVLNGIGVKLGLAAFLALVFVVWKGGEVLSNYYGNETTTVTSKNHDSVKKLSGFQ